MAPLLRTITSIKVTFALLFFSSNNSRHDTCFALLHTIDIVFHDTCLRFPQNRTFEGKRRGGRGSFLKNNLTKR